MKRLSRMVMSILLICAMSMVGIAQAESTLVVNLNTMGDRSKLVLENGITEFETANPGYKCDLEWGMDVSDWGEYASQLMTKFAAGEQMGYYLVCGRGPRFSSRKRCRSSIG